MSGLPNPIERVTRGDQMLHMTIKATTHVSTHNKDNKNILFLCLIFQKGANIYLEKYQKHIIVIINLKRLVSVLGLELSVFQ